MERYNCIIVANGQFPTRKEILEQIKNAECVIACDGAVEHLDALGLAITAVVGDLDSLQPKMRQKYQSILVHIKDQESNDITKAVNHAITLGYKRLLVTGATGLREDHTLGNISLLANYIDIPVSVEIISDFGIFTPINKTTTLSATPGQQVSLFSVYPNVPISITGLQYPLHERRLLYWWEGTLNEALSTEFTIMLHEQNGKIIVYRLHTEIKK